MESPLDRPFIIFEGTDCSGKTTMAEKLLKELRYAYLIKQGYKPRQASMIEIERVFRHYKQIYNLYSCYQEYASSPDPSINRGNPPFTSHLIFDRFFFSELVYGVAKRDYNQEHIEYCLEKMRGLSALIKDQALIVFVYEADPVIHRRIKQRGDDYVDGEKAIEIQRLYRQLLMSEKGLHGFINPIKTVSIQSTNRDAVKTIIDKFIKP